jgi:hypothetical protein
LAKTVNSGILDLKQKFEISSGSYLQKVEIFPSNQDLPKMLEIVLDLGVNLISNTKLYLEFGLNSNFEFQIFNEIEGDSFTNLISESQLWNEEIDPDFSVANDSLLRNWYHLDFLKGLTRRDRFFSSYSLSPAFTDPTNDNFILTTNVHSLHERSNLFRDFYLNSTYFQRNFKILLAKSNKLRLLKRDEKESGFISEDLLVCTTEGRLRILSKCRMKVIQGKPSLEMEVAEDYDPTIFTESNYLTRIQVNGLKGFNRKGAMEAMNFWGSFNGQKILEQNSPLLGTSDSITDITEQTPLLHISSFFWETQTEAELVYLRLVIDRFPHNINPVDNFLILDFPSSFGFKVRYDIQNEVENNSKIVECIDRNRPTISLKCHVLGKSRLIIKYIGLASFEVHDGKDDIGDSIFHLHKSMDLMIHNILLPNYIDNPSLLRQAPDLFFRECNAHILSQISRQTSRWLYFSSRKKLNNFHIPIGVYSTSSKRFLSYSDETLKIQIQQAGLWLPYFNILGKNYFIREYSDLYIFFGVPLTYSKELEQLEIWLELDPAFFISAEYVRLIRQHSDLYH